MSDKGLEQQSQGTPPEHQNRPDHDENIEIPPIPKETAGTIIGAAVGAMAGPVGAVVGGVVGAMAGKAAASGRPVLPRSNERSSEPLKNLSAKRDVRRKRPASQRNRPADLANGRLGGARP